MANRSRTPVFRCCALALLLAFSGSLKAQNTEFPKTTSVIQPQKVTIDLNRLLEVQRINQNMNTVSELMSAEMLLQNGYPFTALRAYADLFRRSEKPEIAERAMEIALDLRRLDASAEIYEKWQEIEPVPSAAQKRMGWQQNILMGQTDRALAQFPELLPISDEAQQRQIFLYVADMAIKDADAQRYAASVHREALKFPEMEEAAVADVIFAARSGNRTGAVGALQRLARADTEIHPATLLALNILMRISPQTLLDFFKNTDTAHLSDLWQSLHVEVLLHENKSEEAYRLILQQLNRRPTVELYTQAGYLAFIRGESAETALGFLNKAYAIGARAQQSRAALFAAVGSLKSADGALIAQWTQKIHDGDYDFDKNILLALVAADAQDWAAARRYLAQAEKAEKQEGVFFNQDNILRLRADDIRKNRPPQRAAEILGKMIAGEQARGADGEKNLSLLYYSRGLLYADEIRDIPKAVADLEKYLAFNPDNAEAQNALGYTLLFLPARLDEGVALIEKAHRKMPDSAPILDSLGWGYYLQGKPQQALPLLQAAFAEMEDAEVGAHLGEVLWSLNRRSEAQDIWRKVWTKNKDHRVLRETLQKHGVRFE